MRFFLQAEDGIRDYKVTGVQTCALPIFPVDRPRRTRSVDVHSDVNATVEGVPEAVGKGAEKRQHRSEERRVGKECRSRWWPDHLKKKKYVTITSIILQCQLSQYTHYA